ncbi:MAG: hypothetical protein FD157_99 [Rhodocyclaceae bacterium]|nr:MAG: hypothetical protein FD157_99 [Rhodocyclaceae bacterium]TND04917.1 MAG: hypothetical protein FD118_736 [Rhodocyclaceae bacterium]
MPRNWLRSMEPSVALVPAVLIYLLAVKMLSGQHPPARGAELSVRLPLAAQVLMAGGDRHLAANIAGIRVLVADTFRMKPEEFRTQARLQKDISWLNPAHEDNYYIAAAILSEPELIPSAQYVLRRAANARPHDWSPLFYFGFNLYQFEKNPAAGAEALLEGATRAKDVQEQWALQSLAAKWIERGYHTGDAARLVGNMAESAPPGGFRRYLNLRAERLRQLDRLKSLAQEYRDAGGHRLTRIEDLIDAKLLDRVPLDPLGMGFTVDSAGEPIFRTQTPAGAR